MGAVQAYHWAVHCADLVLRFAAICGAARASEHNRAFLQGMAAALTADANWNEGRYVQQPAKGLRAMALAWAAWPPSAHFYRQRLYTQLGYSSLDEFLERYWVATYGVMDANNLLCQIQTWCDADISRNNRFAGDFPAALRAITARALVMPCLNDAYFPPHDNKIEVDGMSNAEFKPIDSAWGHWSGSGRNSEDLAFIDSNLTELLRRQNVGTLSSTFTTVSRKKRIR
jgi:homoserine O-acetyltransferase